MLRLLTIPLGMLALLIGAMYWSGTAAERRADFTFINRGDIGTLDPRSMSWLQDIRVGYALWEGLYQLDPLTLQAVPGAAHRVDLSDDKTVYTFHIRPEARWSNGDPVTAGDFAFAWKRVLDDPGDYTYLLYCIAGAEEYQKQVAEGKRPDFASVGIEPIDDRTLRVRLRHPVAYFPDICAFPISFPLHERAMEPRKRTDSVTGKTTWSSEFTRDLPLVCNGPFTLTQWEFKKRLRLEANPHYWDKANVRSEVIDQLSSEDMLASFVSYETGTVDWLAEVTGEIASELRAKQEAGQRAANDLRIFTGFGTYFYSINCLPKLPDGRANPFADVRVRRALSLAIDKRQIVENITRMGEEPADTYIPRGIFNNYTSPTGFALDVERARADLSAAGYPGGKGFPRFPILFNTGMHHGEVAQNIARQWQQNLGLQVDLEGVEMKVFRQRLHSQDYHVARASWIGDYNDVSTFTDKYLSVSDNNDSKWVSRRYDELCARAALETDPSRRLTMFTEAERILLDEAPIIPIYYYVNAYLHRDNVKGIPLDPRNMLNFKSVYVEK